MPGNTCTRFVYGRARRVLFRQGIAMNRPVPILARLPPPPSTFILAAVCRASRTHPAVAVRACTDAAELRKVPGVRAIHMSSTRHNAANRRQSYGYRTVQWSSTWSNSDLIYFRKRSHHCAARSVGYFWPVAGVGYRRACALHSHSMRQGRGRYAKNKPTRTSGARQKMGRTGRLSLT